MESRCRPDGPAGGFSYKRELMVGEVVTVTSRVLEIREKLIRFQHEMRSGETGDVAAVC